MNRNSKILFITLLFILLIGGIVFGVITYNNSKIGDPQALEKVKASIKNIEDSEERAKVINMFLEQNLISEDEAKNLY